MYKTHDEQKKSEIYFIWFCLISDTHLFSKAQWQHCWKQNTTYEYNHSFSK